jgi:transposase-like protein
MKPQEKRLAFIKLRAEGKSYQAISKELNISKDTCSRWERELKEEINTLKAEHLQELYDSYYMVREARITQLGDTLNNINEALSKKDLEELPPDRLLDFKLKYMEALKEEYIELNNINPIDPDYNAKDILNTLGEVLNGLRDGSITPEQASRESQVIGNMLKAYDMVELKERLDAIEAVLGGRD